MEIKKDENSGLIVMTLSRAFSESGPGMQSVLREVHDGLVKYFTEEFIKNHSAAL